MKGLKILGALVLALALSFTPAIAADVTVVLSTTVPTAGVGDFFASGMPHIAGGAKIRNITLSNYGGAAVQTVDLYRTATSSTAAAIEMTFVVPASTTLTIPITSGAGWQVNRAGLKKSDTGSTVKAHVTYE